MLGGIVMKMKRLGRTNLMVTENSFGALPIQRLSSGEAAALLRRAYDAGINFFDTARAYTDSEEKIGLGLSDVRGSIVISTKSAGKTRQAVLSDLSVSLEKLKTGYVDIMQLHNIPALPDPADPESPYAALVQARREGKCRFIGITTHRIDVALAAAECGLYDTVQFPLSYLSSEQDLKLIEVCRQRDVGLIAMKALAGGLVSSGTAAFAFFAQFDNAVPIWGIQRQSELQEFLDAAAGQVCLTPALRAVIEQDKQVLTGDFCRGCGYCKPCPASIDIPWVGRMSLLLRRAPWQEYATPEWQEKMRQVEQCISCGACKSRCPYGIDGSKLTRDNWEDYQSFMREKGILQ